ncbi:hypothetical protein OS493_001309 [Desmophyllum pertusum]|uniref:Uncharacterized protein n=1 Tax=Desmophyllum pertusum TaxID=174260 RepID=A0A9W9ZVY2_9CNID|nr:hypothetical protein OS493_001309 [Desmophyllum pertusum]
MLECEDDVRYSKTDQIVREMCNYGIDVLGVKAIEERWTGIKEGMCGASDHVLGFKNRSQLRWITGDSLKKAEERKKIKEKINATRSERRKGMLRKDYRAKDK